MRDQMRRWECPEHFALPGAGKGIYPNGRLVGGIVAYVTGTHMGGEQVQGWMTPNGGELEHGRREEVPFGGELTPTEGIRETVVNGRDAHRQDADVVLVQ